MNRRRLVTLAMLGAMSVRVGKAASPLRVGAALPDPPFEFLSDHGPAGFDVALMQRIAEQLGREWRLVRYTGADFNDIFAGLDNDTYDCIASGTTITPDRERVAELLRALCDFWPIAGRRSEPSSKRAWDRGSQGPCHRRAAGEHEPTGC
jgi:Bacterial extracellular solute-binding proteins, family 3